MNARDRWVDVTIDEHEVSVPEGISVAAALARVGATTFRRSIDGEPRAAMCGMGVCFECRVTIDGRPHQLSCQIPVRAGMEIRTDD